MDSAGSPSLCDTYYGRVPPSSLVWIARDGLEVSSVQKIIQLEKDNLPLNITTSEKVINTQRSRWTYLECGWQLLLQKVAGPGQK